ncbi:MAG: glycosyltransferase [Pseudothermotoga sp.]|uniref:glycosyltransferase n=1 Tax=Pseudothermotoga sp. TaxID=2033661 RepID=UPI0019AF2964|nr:glycosyltransferase [Pseudothermotoga sp.]MBC7122781.1 glycosyltransferase [Pseudothermotoga sp.]MDI6863488.1 glycosyltransferase [Pseudothermotoga sp.]
MNKKRVLQIITRSDWTGAQKVLYSLVYGLKQFHPDEFEVEVACGPHNGMLIPELEKLNVKVHVVKDLVREIDPWKDLKAYFQLKQLIRQGKYDVVHLHSSKAGFLGRIAAKRCKVPMVVYTVHGWWPIEQYKGLKRRFFILLERFAAKHSDKIVFLCQRDLQKAKGWKIGKDHQYVVIPNAIIPEPPAEKGTLRKELGIPQDVKVVGNVARLDPQKNPIRFLEVAKLVLQERSDVVFVWIGASVVDDVYGKEVQRWLAQNPQVKEKVYFLPFRKDAVKLMADFDVLLLTSDAEGMPLVVLEALSQGVPVVSTDVGCVGEMIEKHFVGNSPEELARILTMAFCIGLKVNMCGGDLSSFVESYRSLYITN